ncbi:MAG: hypothetical protein U9Q92_00520 [archaeon]|nr:hypothetical protein [archaeon]
MRFVQLFLLAAIVAAVAVSGCADPDIDAGSEGGPAISDESFGNTDPDVDQALKQNPKVLTDFQIEACNAADKAGTCDTKLRQLGIVSKEDCCNSLSKCCQLLI